MTTIERLINHRKNRETIAEVNEAVDELLQMVGLATTRVMLDWRKQYEHDMEEQRKAMETQAKTASLILDELHGFHEQMDAVVLLKAAIDKMQIGKSDLAPNTQDALKSAFRAIVSKSNTTVHATPGWFIQESEIKWTEKPFASGSYGTVHRGTLHGNASVVVKMLLPGENGLDAQLQQAFHKEAGLWYSLNHPNVLRMLGACHVSKRPFIVCVDATNGNMADYLERSPANKQHFWRLMCEAAQGIDHLHHHKIIHGDLKLNNLLVSDAGAALVADFGLSRIKQHSKSRSATKRKDGQEVEGGLRWRAPELDQVLPQFASDVYSLAMCILEAFYGEPPYAYFDDASVKAKVSSGELPPRPSEMADDEWKLIQRMTVLDFKKRIELKDAIGILKRFVARELDKRATSALECGGCFLPHTPGSKFCHQCGFALVAGVVAHSVVRAPPSIAKLLGDLFSSSTSAEAKTAAVQQLHRRFISDTSQLAAADNIASIQSLLDVARDETYPVTALYAFGCLVTMAASGCDVPADELSEIQTSLYDKVLPENLDLPVLFTSDDTDTRDEFKAVELVELLVRLGAANQNALEVQVKEVARVFRESSNELRSAALSALVVITSDNNENLQALRQEPITNALLTVIRGGSEADKDNAAALLEIVTVGVASAELFVSPASIHTLVTELQDGTALCKQHLARALGNIAKAPGGARLIGLRGGVFVLLTLLQSDESETLRQCAMQAPAQLVQDRSIGAMFKAGGGVQALEQSMAAISNALEDDAIELLRTLTTFVENNAELRDSVANSSQLLDVCIDRLKHGKQQEREAVAMVLHELVKTNASVARALDRADGLNALVNLAGTRISTRGKPSSPPSKHCCTRSGRQPRRTASHRITIAGKHIP